VLIVDDEEGIREMIKEYLSIEDYVVDLASDGKEALEMMKKETYSIIVLDIMMPKVDGWSVCREIRRTSQVPIIMVSARGEEYDKLFGFELGVDDYMVKPFSPKELLARIKSIIRRSTNVNVNSNLSNSARFQGLEIDFDSRNVKINGSIVTLTPKEYELLSFFIKNPNKVFSRDQLLNQVWGYDFYGDNRTVDTHVKMLRESLGEYRKLIVTVWRTGYKFEVGETR
jgi:DNA-binding response OmpR family regulator